MAAGRKLMLALRQPWQSGLILLANLGGNFTTRLEYQNYIFDALMRAGADLTKPFGIEPWI